jgi:hypothetical protein
LISVILITPDTEEYMKASLKKTIFNIALLLVSSAFSFANEAADNVPFSRVMRMDWNLAEVKNGSTAVLIDRTGAQTEIYSIRFMEGRIQGRGAGNLYSAPYTAGVNNSLSIRKIAGTYMAPIFEMENFREYDYFKRLEKVYRWEFHDYKLRLYSHDENGGETILEFIPIYK